MKRTACLVCGYVRVAQIIDLGMHAFADTFVPSEAYYEPDEAYPLVLGLCQRCGHVQSICITEPSDRYQKTKYSYTSSNSSASRTHWDEFAKTVGKTAGLSADDIIIEAGSNDGYLLQQFTKGFSADCTGVDPSKEMAVKAKERGIETYTGFFEDCAKPLMLTDAEVKLVIANNVLNHSNRPVEFVRTVEKILNDDGWFVCEVPYWSKTVSSGRFDQIYHEHVSYFTVQSMAELLLSAGLVIRAVEVVDYHGGSLRVFAQRRVNPVDRMDKTAFDLIDSERKEELFRKETYAGWMKEINRRRDALLTKVYQLRESGVPLVAVGAAAKGNTFLTYVGLDSSLVDFVTDASKEKQGKYTPLTRIPIAADTVLAQYNSQVALIFLAWNIPEVVVESVKKNIDPKCFTVTLEW